MKQINYTGSSKLISRIVSLLNRKAPLPLDGNGDPDWGSNGQVLSTDGAGSTTWVNQGGGGGGSTVTWTQVQASGTKIAEISINGTPTDVYTPTPPAVIGDLGDVNIATPANGQILKYNSTSQKWENANESGGGSTYSAGDGIDITNDTISVDTTFTDASTRTNIASGDTFATILGKIKKFFADLATVAFSGSYTDLSNTPTIPAAQIQSDWNQTNNALADYIKNKPTNVSAFTNDAGYITSAGSCASATNADKVDNFHFYSERYVRKIDLTQPTAGAGWGICVSTTDWDSLDHVVQIRCEGSNYSATAIIHTSSRSTAFWGYQTSYNGIAVYGVSVSADSATRLHLLMPAAAKTVSIYMDFFGSAATENTSGVWYITTGAGFFRNNPREVTTLVDETVTIAASSSKTYSALTDTALSTYDELHFMVGFGNVFINGSITKAQMAKVTAYTSPANGRIYFNYPSVYSGVTVMVEYGFRLRADSSGLILSNSSSTSSISSVFVQGIKYN